MPATLLFKTSSQLPLSHAAGRFPAIKRRSLKRPADRLAERFAPHCSTGFAAGQQRFVGPRTHPTLPQFGHQQTMRQQNEIKVPGLARAVAQLTISATHRLLAVALPGFSPCESAARNRAARV